MSKEITQEEMWRLGLLGELPELARARHWFKRLPSNPRCKQCYVPFAGIGGQVARLVYHKRPSPINPRFCNTCYEFLAQNEQGYEVDMALVFADIRGSTTLAEQMSPREFSQLIHRFYVAATEVFVSTDAWIDKLVGDEVIAFYMPGMAGPGYPRMAIRAAQGLLRAVGYGSPGGPWIQVGAGVHTGTVYLGPVGNKDGMRDITALGDPVNTAARLASQAAPGEMLVSEATLIAAGLDALDLERRELQLKGRSEAVAVRVLRAEDAIEASQPVAGG